MRNRYVVEIWYPWYGWYGWDESRFLTLSKRLLKRRIKNGYAARLKDRQTGMILSGVRASEQ